jgi:uncharacterized lipoprotein YmbA
MDEELHSSPEPTPRQTVIIGPVSVPALVDRPQLVLRDGGYGITVNEQERWAAPLKDQLSRVLATQLSALQSSLRFVTADSAAVNVPIARLSIDFGRLDFGPDGEVHVSAHWVYRPSDADRGIQEGESRGDAIVSAASYPAHVDALRRASDTLAKDLLQQLSGSGPL